MHEKKSFQLTNCPRLGWRGVCSVCQECYFEPLFSAGQKIVSNPCKNSKHKNLNINIFLSSTKPTRGIPEVGGCYRSGHCPLREPKDTCYAVCPSPVLTVWQQVDRLRVLKVNTSVLLLMSGMTNILVPTNHIHLDLHHTISITVSEEKYFKLCSLRRTSTLASGT